jgi:hypothetical protein
MTDQQSPEPQWINNKGEAIQFGGGEPRPDDRQQFQSLDAIAELGWQSHIAWERIIGEQPKPDWSALSPGQKVAIVDSVRWLIEHPTSSVVAQHDAWRARMAGEGWLLGEHKDDVHHPNMIPFDELPFSQQMKARLWRHIIFAVLG